MRTAGCCQRTQDPSERWARRCCSRPDSSFLSHSLPSLSLEQERFSWFIRIFCQMEGLNKAMSQTQSWDGKRTRPMGTGGENQRLGRVWQEGRHRHSGAVLSASGGSGSAGARREPRGRHHVSPAPCVTCMGCHLYGVSPGQSVPCVVCYLHGVSPAWCVTCSHHTDRTLHPYGADVFSPSQMRVQKPDT